MNDKISGVDSEGIAAACGIEAGDMLVSINGQPVLDYIDYARHMAEESLLLLVQKKGGELEEIEIEKQPYEDLGMEFEGGGFGRKIACRNKCVFCFVDQLPKGMRKTLYFKDDDWRLSFLMGNYITLTNLGEDEICRIIDQKISPLYISVHAVDDDVRALLLGNEDARGTFDVIKRLARGGIKMHTQIVVCEGINDGQVLRQSIEALYALHPAVQSVAVIPVGLTGHRQGLHPLSPISRENARAMAGMIEIWQQRFLKEAGTRFVFGADELYIRAGLGLPADEDAYEGYVQIENGVGLIAKFRQEVRDALGEAAGQKAAADTVYGIVTGVDFYPFMLEIAREIGAALGAPVHVYKVENRFFGETITVTGLLTGEDIISQLEGKIAEDVLLIGGVCFKENERVLLDGTSLKEIEKALHVRALKVYVDGYDFVDAFLGNLW